MSEELTQNYLQQYQVFHQIKHYQRTHRCSLNEAFIYWQLNRCYHTMSRTIMLLSNNSPAYHQMAQLYLKLTIVIFQGIKRDWQIVKSLKKKSRSKKK